MMYEEKEKCRLLTLCSVGCVAQPRTTSYYKTVGILAMDRFPKMLIGLKWFN